MWKKVPTRTNYDWKFIYFQQTTAEAAASTKTSSVKEPLQPNPTSSRYLKSYFLKIVIGFFLRVDASSLELQRYKDTVRCVVPCS